MKAKLGTALALAAILALAGCGDSGNNGSASNANMSAALTQIPAPNGGDWTQIVSETPEGGFRMGNPNAPVKLVEYASITCPHCGEFSAAAADPLENQYVRSGQVSWEYRPFILFPSDPGVFMLLRCQGPTPFFRLVHQLYDSQREWAGRLQSLPPEQQQQVETMSPNAKAAFMVQASGLDQFFRQRGMPAARINSCLADNRSIVQLAENTRRATEQDDVQGTPTFLINGQKQDAGDWNELQRRLRAAIGG